MLCVAVTRLREGYLMVPSRRSRIPVLCLFVPCCGPPVCVHGWRVKSLLANLMLLQEKACCCQSSPIHTYAAPPTGPSCAAPSRSLLVNLDQLQAAHDSHAVGKQHGIRVLQPTPSLRGLGKRRVTQAAAVLVTPNPQKAAARRLPSLCRSPLCRISRSRRQESWVQHQLPRSPGVGGS